MDPDATFEAFLNAIEDHDADAMREAFSDLGNWLDRGGFRPTLDNSQLLQLMEQACELQELLANLR